MANNSGLEEDKEREMPHIAPIDSSKMSGEPQGSGQTHHPEQLDISQPPDGGYGWICVVCVFLINAHTWGLNSSYGVFLAHYLESSAYLGSTDLEFAFVGGLSISQALLLSPIATAAIRVCGTRIVLLIGVFFETLSLIGASHSTQIWQLFLTQGVCFGWGMGFQFVASVGIIPQWFSKRRGLANGIVTSGSGFGGLVYSLAANAMIQNLGLAWTFRMLAILQFTVNFICAILVKDRNMQVKPTQRAFDYRLFKRYEYLLFLGWGFFSMLGYIVVLFSLPNYARSIGLSAKQGSVVGAVLNLGQGLGRPAVGYFSDAAGRINMAALTTFSCGLICFVIWIFAKSYGVLIFFAMLVGTVSGVYWNTVAPIGAEVVGLVDLPSALSITWLVLVFPTSFSEPIGLGLRQKSGNIYLYAQVFAGCMYLAAALCMWFLRGWKIAELMGQDEGKGQATGVVIDSTELNSGYGRSATLEKQPSCGGSGDGHKKPPMWRRMVMWRHV